MEACNPRIQQVLASYLSGWPGHWLARVLTGIVEQTQALLEACKARILQCWQACKAWQACCWLARMLT